MTAGEPGVELKVVLDRVGEQPSVPTNIDPPWIVPVGEDGAAPAPDVPEAVPGDENQSVAWRSANDGLGGAGEETAEPRPAVAHPPEVPLDRAASSDDRPVPFEQAASSEERMVVSDEVMPLSDEDVGDSEVEAEPGFVLTDDMPRSSVGHLLDGEGRLDGLPETTPRTDTGPRRLPRVLAVANQKGGVGKTTTAVNLGAALADLGYRVLVVDLDPQGNATTGVGIDARNFELSIYDVLMRDTPLEDCIEPTSVKNLFVVPATIDLAGVEIELVAAFSRELRLRRAIDAIVDDFDFVLIDCPPSLGLLTVNGLAAAGEVLVPIQCEYYALEGLSQLLRNVHLVASNLNEQLEVSTIVLTMYDGRTRLAVEVASEVRSHFADRVCRTVIPRAVRLSEAPSFGQPITVFDPTSRGAVAYRELAKEVSNGAPKRAG